MSILKEFKKALFRYLSLEKFKSIVPLTLILFIVKIFSSLKLLVNGISRNMTAIKKIKMYSFKETIKYFNNK